METKVKTEKKERITDLAGYIRKALMDEIGEEEVTQVQYFALAQKYGLAAPRLSRSVNKPKWMGERQWNQKQNEWFKLTKGLIPQQQESTRFTTRRAVAPKGTRSPSPSQFRHRSRTQNQRNYRRPVPPLSSNFEN